MARIGYALSTEEHGPRELVAYGKRAEEIGFAYAMISDHFHPWIEAQGSSPFVWTVLGGLANATDQLPIGTSVTCPIMRYHPALIAQAAATVAAAMPGRFILGVGTGEYLNEHVYGGHWPPHEIRAAMLEEAVGLIRELWQGRWVTRRGDYFSVEAARIYTLPEVLPPIAVAAAGPRAAELAGRIGDALVNYAPDPAVAESFDDAGGRGKPHYIQLNVCWAEDEAEARKTAHAICPNVALEGELGQWLPHPAHFEQAVQMLTEDDVAEVITCGPDPEKHVQAIQECIDAGYENVHVYQVGSDQEGFFRFYGREILPRFR